jgi:hypothetical protein
MGFAYRWDVGGVHSLKPLFLCRSCCCQDGAIDHLRHATLMMSTCCDHLIGQTKAERQVGKKKAMNHPPATVVAQNLLMQKLGLMAKDQLTDESFNKLVKMFNDDLSENQVEKIAEIFMAHVPPTAPADADEEA